MLREIQAQLAELYDVDMGASVDDYLCDAQTVRLALGSQVERREMLVIAEEPDGISVGLYLHPELRERLENLHEEPAHEGLDVRCAAVEGVSHFVYFMFRASHDEPITQLELELQAEVDKYATHLLSGFGVGLIKARSQTLRRRLYEEVEFADAAHTEAGERYRTANRLAHQYTRRLEALFLNTVDIPSLRAELRRFYRLGAREKIETASSL